MKTYEEGLAEDAARIVAADEAARSAESEEERRDVERRAVDLRAAYACSLAIGMLGLGRPIPGLPLAVLLGDWLRDHADRIGTDAIDDRNARLGRNVKGAT